MEPSLDSLSPSTLTATCCGELVYLSSTAKGDGAHESVPQRPAMLGAIIPGSLPGEGETKEDGKSRRLKNSWSFTKLPSALFFAFASGSSCKLYLIHMEPHVGTLVNSGHEPQQ